MHGPHYGYRVAIAALCLGGWVCACVDVIGPPSDAVRFQPPVRYRGWWALTEACSGLTGDFNAIRWYVVPSHESFRLEGQNVGGVFYSYGNQIVLVDSLEDQGSIVRHEMLHALMPKVRGHPRDQFLDRCGDIVLCVGPCVTDAGGPPDWSNTAPFIAASTLTVGLLAPSPVSLSGDSGWSPITVTVRNNAPYAVRVATPPVIPTGDPVTEAFGYHVAPAAGGWVDSVAYFQVDAAYVVFAPAGAVGSTRRVVFDQFPVPAFWPSRQTVVGEYDVTGTFLDIASNPAVVRVEP